VVDCVTARRAGKVLSVTSQSTTAKFQTALDTASALLACVFVSQVGKAHSVNKVSDTICLFFGNSVCACVWIYLWCI